MSTDISGFIEHEQPVVLHTGRLAGGGLLRVSVYCHTHLLTFLTEVSLAGAQLCTLLSWASTGMSTFDLYSGFDARPQV